MREERDKLLQFAQNGDRAWFALAVAMDEKTNAEVTTRKFSKFTSQRVADNMFEICCESVRFPDLDSGTYELLSMSPTPADPARLWLNLSPKERGITVSSGDTISVTRIMLYLPRPRARIIQ